MTIFDLFNVCDTKKPEIIIYNEKLNPIYKKIKNYPLGNFDKFLGNRTIAYIYLLDSEKMLLRIE